jgi:predicted 2-oxoglutarate/Fe(II)-dependent dioxygenase YbiX
MKSGGKLAPHIHEKGWLSGSIYINVPPKDTLNSGNLNVAEGSDSFGDNSILGKEETIDVKTGSLVLFPSSVTHYTTPFDSDQERIVLAFDVRKPQ